MYQTPNKKHVKILGERVKVIIDNKRCLEEEADGLYDSYNQVIYLKSSYSNRKRYLRVWRHECFHALCDLLGMQLDNNVEETLAHRVSYMMTYEI